VVMMMMMTCDPVAAAFSRRDSRCPALLGDMEPQHPPVRNSRHRLLGRRRLLVRNGGGVCTGHGNSTGITALSPGSIPHGKARTC
jgi:hypothetical protein